MNDCSVGAIACYGLKALVEIAGLLRAETGEDFGHFQFGEFFPLCHHPLHFHERCNEGGAVVFHRGANSCNLGVVFGGFQQRYRRGSDDGPGGKGVEHLRGGAHGFDENFGAFGE